MARELRPRAAKAQAVVNLSNTASSSDNHIDLTMTDSEPEQDNDNDLEQESDLDMDDSPFVPPVMSAESDDDSEVEDEHDSGEDDEFEFRAAKRQRVATEESPAFEYPPPRSPKVTIRCLQQLLADEIAKIKVAANVSQSGQPSSFAPQDSTKEPVTEMIIDSERALAESEVPKPVQKTTQAKGRKPRVKSAIRLAKEAETKRKRDEAKAIKEAKKAEAQAAKDAAREQKQVQKDAQQAKKDAERAKKAAEQAKKAAAKAAKTVVSKKQSKQPEDEESTDCEANDNQDEDDDDIYISKTSLDKAQKKKPYNFEPGYDANLPPLTSTTEIFSHLGQALIDNGIEKLAKMMKGRDINVGTFCSGTEAPVLAYKMLTDYFSTQGITLNFHQPISAEIDPVKSAFIERNYSPKISARDITEILVQRDKDPEWETEWVFTTSYGGKVKIPGNLDILVAGFCCDDFSTLNNHRKNLNEKGESGDTFFAILEYVNRYRPKMVILENVTGAPWIDAKIKDKDRKNGKGDPIIGIDKHFQDLEYEAIFMKLDTKQHYLPHTRQRGYMLCVLRENCEGGVAGLQKHAESFMALVNKLKRPASVPMEAMLLDFDSPLLSGTGRDYAPKQRQEPSWVKCKLGHEKYVQENGLGNRHPITSWRPNGYRIVPDYYSRDLSFTSRTLDFIDISHLRNILFKGLDDRTYGRFLELSQNVFRYEDTNPTGITGCVNPTNFIFLTSRGSRLSGTDALIAQGLNSDAVDIMNMSDSLLNDMSGNAMTSTVVATFMFAALIVFREVFKFEGCARPDPVADFVPEHLGDGLLVPHESYPTTYTPISFEKITALAKQTVRMCVCEGQKLVTPREIQQCKVCKATSCVKCGRNPVHHYESISIERKQPVEFENAINKALPFQIDLRHLSSSATVDFLNQARKLELQPGFTRESWNSMIDKVEQAFSATVFYRSIRRADCFQIVYDSPQALLKLTVSSTSVEWQLYANVPCEPLASSTGKYLRRFPIARMRPTGQDIVKGDWQLWNPKKIILQTTITSSGPLEESFENERGLVDFSTTYIYPSITVAARRSYSTEYLDQDILGEYVRSVKCGQAWNSVHARKSTDGAEPLLLFYNQHLHRGDPKDFFFSFSNDVARKRYAEELAVVCDLPSSWRQPTVIATETASGLTVQGVPIADFAGKHVEDVDICLNGYWVPIPGLQFGLNSRESITYNRLPAKLDFSQSSCNKNHAVFDMAVQLLHKPSFTYRKGTWTIICKANKTPFWNAYRCLVEKELVLAGHCELDNSWVQYKGDVTTCSDCSPPPPSMQWTFDRTKGRGFGKQIPVENPEQASVHERAMKNRPSAIEAVYRVSANNMLDLKIAINPMTLMHRAMGSLLLDDTSSRTGELIGNSLETSFRLITDDGKAVLPVSTGFVVQSTKDVVPLPTLVDPESPFTGFSTKPIPLLPAQSKVLTWMLDQERNPQPFVEQVVAEASAEDIGYRLEGKATRKVKVAGGILGQAVGFGKTILILSIIAFRFKEAQEHARNAPNVEGAIRTQATLVLVPPHLVDQWSSEARKFMNLLYGKVIVIKRPAKLKTLTVRQIKEAAIVIVPWDICSKDPYQEAFAQFSGNVRYASNATMRAQREWQKYSAGKFAANVEALKSYSKKPTSFKKVLKAQFEASIAETNEHDEYVPSKHVTGAKYEHALARSRQIGEKRKRIDASDYKFLNVFDFDKMANGNGIDDLRHILLEMFSWERVVIDEHTYGKARPGLILEFVRCSNIWLLSGTPSLSSFHDVKAMASLLGVNLGCDDHSIMKSDVLRKKMSEFTASEKFSMYQETPTLAWQQNRMKHAQTFLDHFARQDEVDVSGVKIERHIIRVDQSPSEKALYMELMNHVVANDFWLNAVKATSDNKAQQIDDASSEGEDGKLALFLSASACSLGINPGGDVASNTEGTTPSETCQIVESIRTHEYSEMLHDFQNEFSKAQQLYAQACATGQSCPEYYAWLSKARGQAYGDPSTAADIHSCLNSVSDSPARCAETGVVRGLITSASYLNEFCEKLVIRNRSLRAFQNMLRIQSAEELACSNCHHEAGSDHVTLLTACGHFVCDKCDASHVCGVTEGGRKCNATVELHQRLSRSAFGVQKRPDLASKFGSKIDYVVKLIQNKVTCHEILSTEKVLVFVQFEKTQKKLEEAFRAAGIKSASLSNPDTASGILRDFQSRSSSIQVLVMLTASETASGSNLTCARHLIFFQPLYTAGSSARQEYDSAMTQAIGRSCRLGQQGTVVVYELLTTSTIEIDYREHRGNCLLQGTDSDESLAEHPRTFEAVHGPLSSAIAHHTEFDG
ncbi:hypothetical protein BKA64DRAFT_640808 [Cadophora sp. MPI-SDFR-AT-0126]|nr:hypothetical protein BKA64DRAFT_640808 [Leotiomycetes sp. MPI-SDFR-AT-0126]